MALTVGIANGQAPMMPATASNSIARIDSLTFELLHSIPSHNPVKAIQTNYITKTKFEDDVKMMGTTIPMDFNYLVYDEDAHCIKDLFSHF